MTRTELIARLNSYDVFAEDITAARDMLESDAVSPEQHYMNGFAEGTKRTNALREAARLALDALDSSLGYLSSNTHTGIEITEAIAALKEALK